MMTKSDVIDPTVLNQFANIVGATGLKTGLSSQTHNPGYHQRNLDAGIELAPSSTDEVREIVELCAAKTIPIVPQGGRTGLAGGAATAPGQIILSTTRLNKIVAIDPLGGTATIEAGVRLATLEAAVNEHGLTVGIDLGARDSATIGGMISTNAGGIEAFRNGVMRRRVLGLEAVLADGTIYSELKRVGKANEGYDIKQLMIGAEGTLGIVTKAVLELLPLPIGRATALLACAGPDEAVSVFRAFRNSGEGRLLSAEIMWPTYARTVARLLGDRHTLAFHEAPDACFVLIEVEGLQGSGDAFLELVLGEALESGAADNAIIAKNESERAAFWRIREESFAIDNAYPHGFWFDVSVPHDCLANYTKRLEENIFVIDPDLTVWIMGHLGDGNLHLTISAGVPKPDAEAAVSAAVLDGLSEMGGSFSAEHGIGLEKRQALKAHGATGKHELMRAIKQIFDPRGIMNPGKIL